MRRAGATRQAQSIFDDPDRLGRGAGAVYQRAGGFRLRYLALCAALPDSLGGRGGAGADDCAGLFGVATSTAREHIGVDLFLRFLPQHVRPYVVHASRWILFLVSVGLVVSSYDLVQAARVQTTESGLPQVIYVIPVLIGSLVMMVAALELALRERARVVLLSGAGILALAALGYVKLSLMADPASAAAGLMLICFVLGILAGVPIAFTLGMSAMVFFICDPSLPFVFSPSRLRPGSITLSCWRSPSFCSPARRWRSTACLRASLSSSCGEWGAFAAV